MIDVLSLIRKVPGTFLLAGACGSTLLGLLFMVAPSFIPDNALVIMGGMTLGHVFGLGGVLLFAATIMHEIITGTKISWKPSDQPSKEPEDESSPSDPI